MFFSFRKFFAANKKNKKINKMSRKKLDIKILDENGKFEPWTKFGDLGQYWNMRKFGYSHAESSKFIGLSPEYCQKVLDCWDNYYDPTKGFSDYAMQEFLAEYLEHVKLILTTKISKKDLRNMDTKDLLVAKMKTFDSLKNK